MTSEFNRLVENAASVPYDFPTKANRIARLGAEQRVAEVIARQAAATYPIVHPRVVTLVEELLANRRADGSAVEQSVYDGMDAAGLIDKLLRKRPLAFLTPLDSYLLRDGETNGHGGFDSIGTDDEQAPLVLREYNSYREMAIAALVGVSTPTYFINDGDRGNRGRPGAPGSFEEQGVYVGLVGARFERREQMEWRHMVITPTQNTTARGYGLFADPESAAARELAVWARLYDEGDQGLDFFPDFDSVDGDDSGDYIRCGRDRYLNARVYRRRMRMSVEPYLIDANQRAKEAGRQGYVIAVGLGLGVWQLCSQQGQLLVDVFHDVLADNRLEHLSDLNFSWFPRECVDCGGAGDGEQLRVNGNDLRIHFTKRSPAAPLEDGDGEKLLVACFAWDGNAYPGNEYWEGSLSASGDPAAACCSTIPELMNVDVNPALTGEGTRVAGGAPYPRRLVPTAGAVDANFQLEGPVGVIAELAGYVPKVAQVPVPTAGRLEDEEPAADPMSAAPPMAEPRTSASSPIRVDWLLESFGPRGGKLGLTFTPGKRSSSSHGAPWSRDLSQDLDRLKAVFDVDLLISLVEDKELEQLGVADLVEEANKRGIAVIRSPVIDGDAPTRVQARVLTRFAVDLIQGGQRVVFHCRGGLGRAGTLGACTLARRGHTGRQAINGTRAARPGAIETPAQEDFVLKFAAALSSDEG